MYVKEDYTNISYCNLTTYWEIICENTCPNNTWEKNSCLLFI